MIQIKFVDSILDSGQRKWYNFILCCKPFARFVRCAIYNIVIETFDTLSCPDKNFNIYLHFLLFM